MPYTTLISAAQLLELQSAHADGVIFDCSFDLGQAQTGATQYQSQHIAGARYAHLDHDLSVKGDPTAASGGRHPLPSREAFARWVASQGVSNSTQVVVYDRQGVNYCGRLWWMLKWLGHNAVAVLDGGLQAWIAAGGAMESGNANASTPRSFNLQNPLVRLVDVQTVEQNLGRSTQHLLDARATARYRGEVEPLDPRAGHIPGALNRPFAQNFAPTGLFKPAHLLREEFSQLLGLRKPAEVVHHCGSGVSAVPNILAMEIAGLENSALFAGSWSQWCENPERPIATA